VFLNEEVENVVVVLWLVNLLVCHVVVVFLTVFLLSVVFLLVPHVVVVLLDVFT
jgi:hypothetical protein